MTTYLLHVAGKTIGRESGLRPIPVQVSAQDDRTAFEDVMLATVRRCLPLPAGASLEVEWRGAHRASVSVRNGGLPYVAARFHLSIPTAADLGVPQLPKV